MSKNSHAVTQDDATVESRRGLLRGAGLATAAALLGTEVNHPAEAKDDGVVPAPVFFPTPYKPELSLLKKNTSSRVRPAALGAPPRSSW